MSDANDVSHEIEKALEKEGLDKQSATKVSNVLLSETQIYSGPIPSAKELERYENVLEGSANRLLQMAEKQGDHRRALEIKSLEEEIKFKKRGQFFGLLISILIILVAGLAINNGQGLVGLGAIVVGIGTIITSFIATKDDD